MTINKQIITQLIVIQGLFISATSANTFESNTGSFFQRGHANSGAQQQRQPASSSSSIIIGNHSSSSDVSCGGGSLEWCGGGSLEWLQLVGRRGLSSLTWAQGLTSGAYTLSHLYYVSPV